MFRHIIMRNKFFQSSCLLNYSKLRFQSNAPIPQENLKNQESGLREKRANKRKPSIEPFAKNFFCGKVNTDILAFPEILNKEELLKLSQFTETLENLISTITKDGEENNIDPEKLKNVLKSVDAFALNIPIEYGGHELTVTEICRVNEIFCKKYQLGLKILSTLGNGVEELLLFGNKNQKDKYLQKISKGDCSPLLCFYEKNQNTLNQFKATGKVNANRNAWIINGEKYIYKDMQDTDVLLIFVMTEMEDFSGNMINACSAFLIDSDTPGINKMKVNENYYKILFENANIPLDSLLGPQDKGLEIYLKSMVSSRLSTGVACCGLIKELISELSQIIIGSDMLSKNERVQEKIAEMACSAYTIESMIYLTSGLIDGYENPDCTMESAMIKVYSTEKCLDVLLSSLSIFGADNYLMTSKLKNKIQSAVNLQLFDENNDYLRLLIGMLGVQQAGIAAADNVKKIRNPLMYPGHILKQYMKFRHFEADNPKLILQLSDYLHPSLTTAAESLEYCILKLQYLSEMLLIRNGLNTPNKQMEINKLSSAAIEIYAMFASVSRASRSYCIGNQNAHHEVKLAESVCKQGLRKVKDLLSEIEIGPHNSNDYSFLKIAKLVYQNSGEFVEHSLKTNY